jgi:hypothetical protein
MGVAMTSLREMGGVSQRRQAMLAHVVALAFKVRVIPVTVLFSDDAIGTYLFPRRDV